MAAAFGLLQLGTDDFGGRGSEDEHSDQSNQEWLASRGFDPRGNRLSDTGTGDDDGDGGIDNDDDGDTDNDAASQASGATPATRGGMTTTANCYPAPPPFTSKHCPPLATPLEAPCNCGCGVDFCDVQHRVADFLRAELRKAKALGRNSTGCDGVRRAPNNKQRKRCYRALAIKIYLNKFRAPLPHCVVAAVRTIWPSANGVYMGYKGR
jgi:hypothetical protein